MDNIKQKIEKLEREIDILWIYMEKAVEEKNIRWIKTLSNSIENKQYDILRLSK